MASGLKRLSATHKVSTIVDVGASNGSWTIAARREFPDTRALLIEAQGHFHREALEALADSRTDFVIAAAGDHEGEIHFDASEPFSGAADHQSFLANDIVVPMTTIDAEVARRALPGPFLLKLDTHGFETEILSGATTTLRDTALLIVEAYNFELRPAVLRFHELCAFVERFGLRCIDLVDVMRRPKDGVLWQMDLVFARADRHEFRDGGYV